MENVIQKINEQSSTIDWKPVDGYDNYIVSNHGDVMSILPRRSFTHPSFMHGFAVVRLSKNGVEYKERVDRLVACAFLENPTGSSRVVHVDGDREDNHVGNLRWVVRGKLRVGKG